MMRAMRSKSKRMHHDRVNHHDNTCFAKKLPCHRESSLFGPLDGLPQELIFNILQFTTEWNLLQADHNETDNLKDLKLDASDLGDLAKRAHIKVYAVCCHCMLDMHNNSEELSVFAIVSPSHSELVRSFLACKSGLRVFLRENLARERRTTRKKDQFAPRLFTDLGLLLKRSTFLLPTRERLLLLGRFITRIFQVIQVESSQKLVCFGHLFAMFTRGWSEKECHWAFLAVVDYFKIKPKLAAVLTSAPGTLRETEYELRTFLRHVFLNKCSKMFDLRMYVDFILRPYPLVHQAKILLLIYGPTNDDMVDWQWMCTPQLGLPASPVQQCTCMAMALKALHSHPSWSEGSVNSVLKELTDCPREWTTRNVAKLLLLCGETICFNFLVSIALNGKMREVANIFVTLSMIIKDENLQMAWLVDLVRKVCRSLKNSRDVHGLLDAIPDLYRDLTVDLQEIPDEETYLSISSLAETQAEVMRELLYRSVVVATNEE